MDDFDQALIKTIRDKNPQNLKEAIRLTRSKFPETEKAIMKRVLRLESQGEISFKKPLPSFPSSITEYFFSDWTLWFWIVLSLTLVVSVMVFMVPQDGFPFVYVRYIFSSIFVMFLPGYCLIKVLFGKKKLNDIERFALSVGLSLGLVPLSGLLLNYTPWGIRTTPVTFCLLALTLLFASTAVIRDYGTQKKIATV